MQETAYEMRISDWSSDVCSSDLVLSELQTTRAHSLVIDLGQPAGRTAEHGAGTPHLERTRLRSDRCRGDRCRGDRCRSVTGFGRFVRFLRHLTAPCRYTSVSPRIVAEPRPTGKTPTKILEDDNRRPPGRER